MIKKVFLLIYLVLPLLINAHDITGEYSLYLVSAKENKIYKRDNKEEYILNSLQINIDYKGEYFYFQATPFMSWYNTSSGNGIRNKNLYNSYSKTEVFFRSLYISSSINNNWSMGLGVLPFSNSSSKRFNSDYILDGEGINMLNENSLTSLYFVYKKDNYRSIIGIGTPDDLIVPVGTYMEPKLEEDTLIAFMINNYKINKLEIITELLYSNMKYERKKLNEVLVSGISLSWDDSEDTGLSVYGALGFSIFKNNSELLRNRLLENSNIPLEVYKYYPNNFSINNKTYYGGASLLGIRKDLDISNKEFFINFEWFHTYGDWSSGNQGNIYNGSINNQIYNVRDDSYMLNIGYIINNKTSLRLSYTYLEFDEISTLGSPAVTVKNTEYIGEKYSSEEYFSLIYSYKF